MPADDAGEVARMKRRIRVMELRAVFCANWTQIGEELGISPRQAKEDFERACAEYGQDTAASHKAKANARFDAEFARAQRVALRMMPQVELEPELLAKGKKPNPRAASVILQAGRLKEKITRDQALMNGAYAPQVIEHRGEVAIAAQTPAKARELVRQHFGDVGLGATHGPLDALGASEDYAPSAEAVPPRH